MKKIAAVCVLPFLCLHPLLGAISLGDVLDNMQIRENEIKSLNFEFKQEIRFSGVSSVSLIEGQAYFQKPKKLRIVKKTPLEQFTITDGKKMWVYTPSYKQVWEGSWQGWLKGAALPKGLVPFGDFAQDLRDNFDLSIKTADSSNPSVIMLKAVPKDQSQDFSIELFISTTDWVPIQTIYVSETARIETILDNIAINNPIAADNFTFKPPKGTEIIQLN